VDRATKGGRKVRQTVRWKQRFSNFEKAYAQFRKVIEIGKNRPLGDIEKMALIQAFEFTFELTWKTMKDFLEAEGFLVNSPKGVLRQAFQSGYIRDGAAWMEGLQRRNDTVHNYDERIMQQTVDFIQNTFAKLLEDWTQRFRQELVL